MNRDPRVFTKRVHLHNAIKCEVEGLNVLSQAIDIHHIDEIKIPAVLSSTDIELCLEMIDTVQPSLHHHIKLAEGLAKLHAIEHPSFGWPSSNYIGASVQPNEVSDNWGRFFVEQRLAFQVSLITNQSLQDKYRQVLDIHGDMVAAFLNATTSGPSLVHGDLWQGNVLFSSNEGVWLIDPAVYWGDREVDIAMTELFGGFSSEFYRRYNDCATLSEHYPLKKQVYNLYHNLNHLNLFGSSYMSACDDGMAVLAKL